jgi:tetratricopeptide (TPR) repeat protein
MQNLFTRMSMLIIAFGFFISCSKAYEPVFTTQPDVSVEELLAQADSERQRNPQSSHASYLEALAYAKLARQKAPGERTDDYRSMRQSFNTSLDIIGNSRSGQAERDVINAQLETIWSNEHNSGAALIASDSSRSTQRLRLAQSHAQNAMIIQPDSLISYELLADTFALLGEPGKAVETLLQADSLQRPDSQRIHEHIAFLYYTQGDLESAITWYESALRWQQTASKYASNDPGDPAVQRGSLINTWHGLINAYIAAGQTEQAITSLHKLLEISPQNSSYQKILGTQLITRIASQFDGTIPPDKTLIVTTISQLSNLNKMDPDVMLSHALGFTEIASTTTETMLAENESFDAASNDTLMLICEAAISLYQNVLAVDFNNHTAIAGLADTYLIMGNQDEAAKWFELLN